MSGITDKQIDVACGKFRRVLDLAVPQEPEGYEYNKLPRIPHNIITQDVKFDSHIASKMMKLFKEHALKYRAKQNLSTCRIASATINGREILNRMRNKMDAFYKLLTIKCPIHEKLSKFMELYIAFKGYATVFNTVFNEAKPLTGYHIMDVIKKSRDAPELSPIQLFTSLTIMIRFMVETYLKLYNQWITILKPYCLMYSRQLQRYNDAVKFYAIVVEYHNSKPHC